MYLNVNKDKYSILTKEIRERFKGITWTKRRRITSNKTIIEKYENYGDWAWKSNIFGLNLKNNLNFIKTTK